MEGCWNMCFFMLITADDAPCMSPDWLAVREWWLTFGEWQSEQIANDGEKTVNDVQ